MTTSARTTARTNKAVHKAVTEMKKSTQTLKAYATQERRTRIAVQKSLDAINKELNELAAA